MLDQRYSHMVHEYYVDRLRRVMRERRARLDSLRTKADAEAYVAHARRAVRRAFAPFPRRTPLKARVTGREVRDGYAVENVIYESRPGFLVTGNLYLPSGDEKRPAVLGLCGHNPGGKHYELYQSFSQGLAQKGFVVFTIDPIAQGERRQFYDHDGGARPGLCHAHTLIGNQQALLGDFFGTWRVWDAIRGLDYLLARPEVDPTRVGATGNSGGGTLTMFLSALDARLTMAAPGCAVGSYLTKLENEQAADSEQNPPGLIGAGLDEADLLICHAPRPTIILSQREDFFDTRAAQQAFEDVRRINALLGRRDVTEVFYGPRDHGYFIENREAMYAFFVKHAGLEGDGRERGVRVVAPEALWATPTGETHPAGSRRAFELNAEAARELRRRRGRPGAEAVKQSARKLLGVPARSFGPGAGAPHHRALGTTGPRDGALNMKCDFAIETEPGVQVIATSFGNGPSLVRPPEGDVTLFVGHASSRDDVRDVPDVTALGQRQRGALLAVDPRGIGQSMPKSCGTTDFFEPYGADFLLASTGEMLGESYLGRRVFDVLRTTDWLLANGAQNVRLMGRGLGSVTAAFAALLHPCEPRVRLLDYLPSYELLVTTPITTWPLSAMLRGCLKRFDLPDVYRALGRRLTKT